MKKLLTSKWSYVLWLLLIIVVFYSCTNKEVVTPCLHGHTYGFLGGLWHGFIAPFDLFGMIFFDDITVFAQNNNGAFYAFGFLLGSGGWGFFGGKGAKWKRK